MRRARVDLRAAAWLVAGLGLAGCADRPAGQSPASSPPPPEPRRIAIEAPYDETVEQSLAGGECHLLDLELEADRYVEATLLQRGIDVFSRLFPPEGGDGQFFDSPTGATGTETVAFVTEEKGLHRLEICPFEAEAALARYDLTVTAPVSPTEAHRATARGFRRYSKADAAAGAGDPEAAIAAFEAALRDFEESGVVPPQAWTRYRLGMLELGLHRFERAEGQFAAAARLYAALEDPRLESSALSYLGISFTERGELEKAVEVHRRMLETAERAGDPTNRLSALLNLATVELQLGHTLAALDYHRRRHSLARELGRTEKELEALIGIGKVYRRSGDDRKAQQVFEEGLALARRRGLEEKVPGILTDLGRVHLDREEPEPALEYLLEALERQETLTARQQVEILNNVGRCHRRLGNPARAIDAFMDALDAIPEGGWDEPVLEGLVLINLASLHNLAGEHEEAAAPAARALELLRAAGRPVYTTGALKCVADVAVARGELHRAASYLEEILEIVETLRGRSALEDLRALFVEDSYSYYQAYVDVLLRLAEREPEGGFVARAFEVADRAKARVLLDKLVGTASPAQSPAAREALARRDALDQQMSELERLLIGRGAAVGSEKLVGAIERRLRELETEHELATARAFAASAGWSDLLESDPVPVEEVQRELLSDGESQLVSFLLGPERSFAWIVGRDSLHVEVLPPQERIELLAREAARHFESSVQSHLALQGRLVLEELTTDLLEPLMPHLTAPRLILAKDGALHYLPFAALPVPENDEGAELLVDRFNLVDVPSASAALALRRREARRRSSDGTADLAILADPVFEGDDERIRLRNPAADRPSAEPAGDRSGGSRSRGAPLQGLRRLSGSREEARRISRLVPRDRRMVAMSFDANRSLLLSGSLRSYRIIHLAGHGVEDPELQGFVLSLYDAQGRPVDGLIRPYEIHGLNLSAELVVLSACSTGLGDEVRGEGLLGLSRGFLYAGASKVLSSLWDVDDEATAALMERFYVALLQDSESPSRALRRAQLSLRAEPRWSAPQYWAGFVLQGDGV